MVVKGLTLDPLTNMPIVILKDVEGNRALPIWIGANEANAIAMEMERITTPRPMTHDLIRNILEGLKAKVSRIVVNDLRDNTFYAVIFLAVNGTEVAIDSRPSDAIALALRVKAPIFVAEKVIREAKSIDLTEDKPAEDVAIRSRLDRESEAGGLREDRVGTVCYDTPAPQWPGQAHGWTWKALRSQWELDVPSLVECFEQCGQSNIDLAFGQ